MKKKIFSIVLIFTLCFLFISAISAAEDNIDNTLSTNDNLILEENTNDIDLNNENGNLKESGSDSESFTDLNTVINGNDNETIYLDKNFTYNEESDSDYKDGILINRSLTIYGNGATIDGNHGARIFKITNYTIVFHDLKFINGNTKTYGGAIYASDQSNCSCNVINCTFIDNHAERGGAIAGPRGYNNCSAINCTFINNSARLFGGAMDHCNVINCTFINNSANSTTSQGKNIGDGGALSFCSVENPTFINNYANRFGGATYEGYSEDNCIFINNTAYENGGAISQGSPAVNCLFINNSAVNGGAVYEVTVRNCNFTNNKAIQSGVIYSSLAYNCIFENNTGIYGGAMFKGRAEDCIFINNHANQGAAIYEGEAINCNFIANNASSEGGAIHLTNATNSNFNNNSARYGGAISSNAVVKNCIFINNIALEIGGAIYNECIAINCTFLNNHANEKGGAMYDCTVINSTFTKNTADIEGGATEWGSVYNCTFTQNSAKEKGGASVWTNAYNCTFINNNANEGGGYYSPYTSVDLINCTFINNSATNGGGVAYGTAINCTFINNTATQFGPGTYEAVAIFCTFENNIYYKTIIGPIINITDYNSTYNSGNKIDILLSYNGQTYDGYNTTIQVFENGKLIETINKLSGENWLVNLSVGIYKAVITVDEYPSIHAKEINMFVKESTKITSTAVTTVYNGNKNLIITIKDSKSKAVTSRKVTVNLNGAKTYTTDKNGQIKISTNNLAPKTYTAKINFNGDNNYGPSSASVKVTVKKAKPKLTAGSKTFRLKAKKKYTVTLKTNRNVVMKKIKVTLTVKGKTYKIKTNTKGQATFTITNLKKKGKYTGTVKYAGSSYYNAVSKKVKITIK